LDLSCFIAPGTRVRPRYEYEYDQDGNLTLIRDPKGRETTFTHDEHGRRSTRTLPLGQTEEYQYNTLGQEVLHVSFEGVVTESVYDNTAAGSGRLAERRPFDNLTQHAGGTGQPREIRAHGYDCHGRRIQVVQDRDGNPGTTADQRATTKTYDTFGRIGSVVTLPRHDPLRIRPGDGADRAHVHGRGGSGRHVCRRRRQGRDRHTVRL